MKTIILLFLFVFSGGMVSIHAEEPRHPEVQIHWAFKPVTCPSLPSVQKQDWPRNPIDLFILARLESEKLAPSAPATPLALLRRLHFDLTGLPPSPEEVNNFLNDPSPVAYERLVDHLLASPAYGERWAQHWLDLIRYADTDGFEVNTERKNAWPYRDYVVSALNADLPYDRFVKEQLAGDLLGQDAATGFMVTAAALLPGQIGADDVSKRLARQDSLDEIIVNTSEAFLGLSVACARCHDHKFDPISQRDYYAMQAFFAGVDYGERPIRSDASEALDREVAQLGKEAAALQNGLRQFEPLARVGEPTRKTNAKMNLETFTPIEAKWVRFTILDANRHPSLGLIEPCIDEFEIYSTEKPERNVALASAGTKVTASGSRTSESHKLEHVNDGQYGNSRSWMSDQAGKGWLLFELPRPMTLSKIVWGRDRQEVLQDRTPIAYTLEAGLTTNSLATLGSIPVGRPPVNARLNVDRWKPIVASRLRFTIIAATSLEPCIDELEIWTPGSTGTNVALASAGTMVKASSTIPNSDIHKLEHINDGEYGNSRSWISSEKSQGWVEFQFKTPVEIERVVWGRDREGKFSDRLVTQYKIEVETADGRRHRVATSEDRRDYSPNEKGGESFSLAGLEKGDAEQAEGLLQKLKNIEKQLAIRSSKRPVVFGGIFRTPDSTRLLNRGDPEQPLAVISPATPGVFAGVHLSTNAPEQERRMALANWIASPANPLTARVMVNRIWQGHFGVGLVDTASDFGRLGSKPSHPELLDWLASEFVRSGWSIKKLHKLILTSATFRQSSEINDIAMRVDADARFLWRFPSRRMEAEMLRDTMLAVSGRLNRASGGPGFNLFSSRGGLNGFPPVEIFLADGLRRMIYAHKVRMERDPVFGAFDCPDAGQTRPRRRQSTTPLQALNLFNSRFTLAEAEAFASRVKREAASGENDKLVQVAWLLAFGRSPSRSELTDASAFVQEHGLAALCRVIYNTNEFLFVP